MRFEVGTLCLRGRFALRYRHIRKFTVSFSNYNNLIPQKAVGPCSYPIATSKQLIIDQ